MRNARPLLQRRPDYPEMLFKLATRHGLANLSTETVVCGELQALKLTTRLGAIPQSDLDIIPKQRMTIARLIPICHGIRVTGVQVFHSKVRQSPLWQHITYRSGWWLDSILLATLWISTLRLSCAYPLWKCSALSEKCFKIYSGSSLLY